MPGHFSQTSASSLGLWRGEELARVRNEYAIFGHIYSDHGICANAGMVSDVYWSDDFGSSANIDMSANRGNSLCRGPNRNLLKYQTVASYRCMWVDNNAVGMRYEEAASNCRVDWNISAGDG